MHHLRGLLQPPGQLGSDQGVGPLHLVGDRLPDVVQQGAPLHEPRIHAEFRGDCRADVSRFDQVPQNVLAVRGPVLQPAEHFDHLGVDVRDPDFRQGLLAGPLDLLVDLRDRPLVHLLDPSGMDTAV